ncbi:MAG: hypothetical protein Q8S26_02175 [Azonexus sp.]|nr:hypothetical protein [Azonexus sp.]
MHQRTLALLIAAAVLGAGCASKETKTEAAPAPAAAPAAAPAPVASKPECPPEPTGKKKTTKAKSSKKAEQPAVDCEPAKPKTAAAPAKAAEPAPAPAKEAAKPAEAGKPRIMKSRDGTFEGEVYGNIPPGSKWSRLIIGMEQPEVERILGITHEVRHTPTGKAYMPFYYGTDRYRNEHVYRGQGSVSYTSGGSWGAGRGVLMMINYDPNI